MLDARNLIKNVIKTIRFVMHVKPTSSIGLCVCVCEGKKTGERSKITKTKGASTQTKRILGNLLADQTLKNVNVFKIKALK